MALSYKRMNVIPCVAHEHINLSACEGFVKQTMEPRSHSLPMASVILQHCTSKVCIVRCSTWIVFMCCFLTLKIIQMSVTKDEMYVPIPRSITIYGIVHKKCSLSKISAPLVKFLPLSEMDRNKFAEIGNPIVLYCELSDPAAPVHWYKNGVELQTVEGLHIQSEGTMRRIVIQSAEFSHSGVYCCDAIDDVIRFNVEVEGECDKCVIVLVFITTNHLYFHYIFFLSFSNTNLKPI